jgi:hypothetical protein
MRDLLGQWQKDVADGITKLGYQDYAERLVEESKEEDVLVVEIRGGDYRFNRQSVAFSDMFLRAVAGGLVGIRKCE